VNTQLSATIDFAKGYPSQQLLPHALMKQASDHFFSQKDLTLLQYGEQQGDEHFRSCLAHFLTQEYGGTVDKSTLFVTAGASQGLDLICNMFTRPGDTIFVEDPSYFLVFDIFANHHLELVASFKKGKKSNRIKYLGVY